MADQKNNKLVTGFSFRPECLAFADAEAKEIDRNRSDFINQLIKEYAQRKGVDLSTFHRMSDEQQSTRTPQAA